MIDVQLSDIPVELLCEATKIADVHQIMILDRKQNHIKRGEPDVAVVSPLGRKEMMHRADIVQSFVTMRGKKLKMSSLRENTKYTVMKIEKVGVYAFKVPKSREIRIVMTDGRIAKTGGYLVCEADDSNSVDMNNSNWVDSKFFKKMFQVEKIPELTRIGRDMGKEYTVSKKNDENIEKNVNEHIDKKDNSMNEKKVVERNVDVSTDKKAESSTAVVRARIVKYGSTDTIGFVVEFCGRTEKMNILKVKKLCSMHIVENMKLVERDGKTFLAGVGIRIEDLPTVSV